MSKKRKVFAILLLIIILLIAGFVIYKQIKKTQEQKFLSQLKGEVVFIRRNADGAFDIWKINANGTGEVMLYHHNYGGKAANFNCSFPQWSDDGSKIYFIAMGNNDEWRVFEMDEDGKNVQVAKNSADYENPEGGSRLSREDDIVVKEGDIYINKNGQEVKIYDHKGYYNQDYAPGASEVSWSPDKKYIIFNEGGYIMIADKNGNSAKLTKGSQPDWKY